MRRTKTLLVAIPLTLALILSACSSEGETEGEGTGEAPAAEGGGSFSLNSSEPEAFAPTSACYSSDCSQIINMVFTPLLRVDPETQEQKLLVAESFETEDSQTWTIKIKDGYIFHNGEAVTAQSFVRAWNYAAYGPNATQLGFFFSKVKGYDEVSAEDSKVKELAGLTAPDETTIQVELTEPFSQFPITLSYSPAGVPMAEACEADIKACNEQPIGNGPYQFDGAWQHNQSITLQKFADYPDEENAGSADEIVFKIYGDLSTAYRDFQGGNLDIVVPDPSQYQQARSTYPEKILEVDDGSYAYFGFPLYEPAFRDVRIRQALSMAINRQEIIDRVLDGTSVPAMDVISPFVPGSRDDACEYCVYDPDEAKRLFDEAGGIPGNKINIWFNNDGGHEQWVQAMAQGWKNDLGLDFEFKSQPFTPYLETLGTQSEVDGPYRLGWLPDYPSAENYLNPLYGSGSSNYGKWEGPKHDEFLALLKEADTAPSVEDGLPLYQQAADIVLDEMVVIPLWFGKTFYVLSEKVDNVKYSPTDQLLLGEVEVSS